MERQLEAALEYGKHLQKSKGTKYRDDTAYRALDRALRELDQYARAIRWVLTVTQNEDAS